MMNTWPLQEGRADPTQAFGEKLCESSVQAAGWLWKKTALSTAGHKYTVVPMGVGKKKAPMGTLPAICRP